MGRPPLKEYLFAILPLLLLSWLWFVTCNHLRVEWSLNEQYSYGWAVPVLCAFLVVRALRLGGWALDSSAFESASAFRHSPFVIPGIVLLAIAIAPVRLFQEANPEWRLISWGLASITVAFTLLWVRWSAGPDLMRALRFPMVFFLIAVPWPTTLEHVIIQRLTAINASLSAELVGWLGVPALARGNVIEITTGVVGIDDACSGIRSLQATLMLALFFGALYRLSLSRRFGLCGVGLLLAGSLNLIRTSLLVFVAARHGMKSMERWHDPAGVAILLGCFTGLWLTALRWASKAAMAQSEVHPIFPSNWQWNVLSRRRTGWLAACIIAWLVFVELGVQSWYQWHESKLPVAVTWTVNFPTNEFRYVEVPLPPRTSQVLRQDFARNATWWERDQTRWQATFLRWLPGSTAVHLARNHTPEVCLAAAGGHVIESPDLENVRLDGLDLPIRFYAVANVTPPLHVLYCLWSDQCLTQELSTQALTRNVRVNSVLQGQRLRGQRSLELAVWGIADSEQARAALLQKLGVLVRREGMSGVLPSPES